MATQDQIPVLIKQYLEDGDQSGFGANDPWALLESSGGLEDLVDKMSQNVMGLKVLHTRAGCVREMLAHAPAPPRRPARHPGGAGGVGAGGAIIDR